MMRQSLLYQSLCITVTACCAFPAMSLTAVFFNEIHYDNAGGDVAEGVEIAAPAGTDLAGWSLVLYNGSSGSVYANHVLDGVVTDQDHGLGVLGFDIPGMQNGGPDGIALTDAAGALIQFLSYEGVFTATDGPAAGHTSLGILTVEDTDTPIGHSLQLVGAGRYYEDFSWDEPSLASFGQVNASQRITGVPLPASLPLLAGAILGAAAIRRHGSVSGGPMPAQSPKIALHRYR